MILAIAFLALLGLAAVFWLRLVFGSHAVAALALVALAAVLWLGKAVLVLGLAGIVIFSIMRLLPRSY